MKPIDAAWSFLKADPDYRAYGKHGSKAMHPAIAGLIQRTIAPDITERWRNIDGGEYTFEEQMQDLHRKHGPVPLSVTSINPQQHDPYATEENPGRARRALRQARTGNFHKPNVATPYQLSRLLSLNPNAVTDILGSNAYDTSDYGRGSKARTFYDGADLGVSASNVGGLSEAKTPDDVLNIMQIPGAIPTVGNFLTSEYKGKRQPHEYGQMSPQNNEEFEEMFRRFMEEQGRRGNPDNVQMLPGDVMQQV